MLSYGTAGFRGVLNEVLNIIEPVAIYLLVNSVNNKGLAAGIQFTASHNVSTDHGMKFCNYDGHSITHEQEKEVEDVVQCYYRASPERKNHELYVWAINHLQKNYYGQQPRIIYGTDMRPGGDKIKSLMEQYIFEWANRLQMRKPLIFENTEVTTPMFQWICRDLYEGNYENTDEDMTEDNNQPGMEYFYKFYLESTVNLWDEFLANLLPSMKRNPKGRMIDYAHGVGLIAGKTLRDMLQKANIYLHEVNNGKDYDNLNKDCGADDLHKTLISPVNLPIGLWDNSKYHLWSSHAINYDNLMGISFDGDADRILYWRPRVFNFGKLPWEDKYEVSLFDGDRLMTLMASVIYYFLRNIPQIDQSQLNIKIVHTAYSNGAAIQFWENSNYSHEYASTGTKHLHPIAEKADIGLYFETNGHGTLMVSDHFYQLLDSLETTNPYVKLFRSWIDLSNDLVGDAIRNVLLIEGSFMILGIHPNELLKLYYEFPYQNHKLYGYNKDKLKVAQEDRVIVEPENMNSQIQAITSELGGRVILRASGTEDLIRLYIENRNQQLLPQMYERIIPIINENLGLKN